MGSALFEKLSNLLSNNDLRNHMKAYTFLGLVMKIDHDI